MKLKFVFILVMMITFTISANSIKDWGNTGHRTIGEIAEKHLSRKAKRKINKLLKGESLAFVSTYMDDIKSDKKYDKYKPWHYVNMPIGMKYENSKKNPKGDLITGINYCVSVLKDKSSSDEEKNFYLKFLIHLIGDMHQPLHVGRAEDWGGNKIQVQWHGVGSNIHRVWDDDMLEKWGMSYVELADNTKDLTKEQIKAIQKGTIVDWLHEIHKITPKVYDSVQKGEKLGYRYSYDFFPTVREQLQIAGIRLAKMLNDIFG
ncbi:MAG: S1/P1 nuclease [Tenacibaculum sp.]|nr:S1/P1 nuclease [Tenacibaculum sp.]